MSHCNTLLEVTNSDEVTSALKLIARYYHHQNGIFANEAFDHINHVFFGGNLPRPLIQIAATSWGACLGLTHTRLREVNLLPPVITLHASTFEASTQNPQRGNRGPWGIDPDLLGMSFAYEVLLHECIHVYVYYVSGAKPDKSWESSHNNPVWVSEVQRIGPLLGLSGNVSMNKPKRVPGEGKTKTGKPKTKVKRMVEPGCLPFAAAVSAFPHGMREVLGQMDFYRDKTPPFVVSRYPVTDNYVLRFAGKLEPAPAAVTATRDIMTIDD